MYLFNYGLHYVYMLTYHIWLLFFELNFHFAHQVAASIASGSHCLLHLDFVTFGMLSVAQCCFFVGTFLINTGIDTEELQLVITNVTSTVYTVARKTTDR